MSPTSFALLAALLGVACGRGPEEALLAGAPFGGARQESSPQESGESSSSVESERAVESEHKGPAAPHADHSDEDEAPMEGMLDKRTKCNLTRDGSMFVLSESPSLPQIRYPDGQLGQSDSCAVRMGNKLNRKIPPAYVNGRPLGFC